MGDAYDPKPLDRTEDDLPPQWHEVSERVARNAHDVWARQRLDEGWRWGAERNEAHMTHPSLVPYEQLPESEKEYDRQAAKQAIKALLGLGFRLLPPDGLIPPDETAPQADATQPIGETLLELLAAWHRIRAAHSPIEAYRDTGTALLGAGEPLVAYDLLKSGLALYPDDPRLRQLSALALARSGAPEAAADVLTRLLEEGHRDAETLGMLARTYKDRAARSTGALQQRMLHECFRLYSEGYESASRAGDADGAIYTGINAAAAAVFLGDLPGARTLATAVERVCDGRRGPPDYWTEATRAEAAVILGRIDAAAERYRSASSLRPTDYANLSTTRRQARALLAHLDRDPHELDSCFSIPEVVAVTPAGMPGGRGTRRVTHRVIAYTLIASSADAQAAQGLLDQGHDVRLVFPAARAPMTAGDPSAKTIDDLVSRATSNVVAHDLAHRQTGIVLRYAGMLQRGLASLRAAALDTSPLHVRAGPDGLWLTERAGDERGTWAFPGETGEPAQQIVAMIFADALHFSRLTEEQLPVFMNDFVGLIATLRDGLAEPPAAQNTWGDGFYFVFTDVGNAGRFALQLSDAIGRTDWAARGLPSELALRIALHAGPAFVRTDPITGRQDYMGSHVSRAARIEPITPPGRVYASEPFAALAAELGVTDFVCEYVGLQPLAKGYGTFATYHVTRSETRSPP
jgi:class 3 adenylate cyclase/tetratricopeptide (TPR) repeat protein